MKNKINLILNNRKFNSKIILIFFIFFSLITTHIISKEIKTTYSFFVNSSSGNDNIADFYRSFLPIRKLDVAEPTISSRSAIMVLASESNDKFLFEKDADRKLPIASITKLMTALIVIDEYDLNQKLVVSENAFMKDVSRYNNLYPGETYKVIDLLYLILVESSNTAAQVLAEGRTATNYSQSDVSFVDKMNKKAKEVGMVNTTFFNSSGLDSQALSWQSNTSTARDLVVLGKKIKENELIMKIIATENYTLRTSDGTFKYEASNTNQLLNDEEFNFLGGKTGTTTMAGGCFLSLVEQEENLLISVVLGSNNRFEETKKIIQWTDEAYFWKKI